MVRGWYGRTVVCAWTFTNSTLKSIWTFDSAAPGLEGYSGMGNHSVTIADFDGDSYDEICVGAMTVDHDGKGLFTTDCAMETPWACRTFNSFTPWHASIRRT